MNAAVMQASEAPQKLRTAKTKVRAKICLHLLLSLPTVQKFIRASLVAHTLTLEHHSQVEWMSLKTGV